MGRVAARRCTFVRRWRSHRGQRSSCAERTPNGDRGYRRGVGDRCRRWRNRITRMHRVVPAGRRRGRAGAGRLACGVVRPVEATIPVDAPDGRRDRRGAHGPADRRVVGARPPVRGTHPPALARQRHARVRRSGARCQALTGTGLSNLALLQPAAVSERGRWPQLMIRPLQQNARVGPMPRRLYFYPS